VRITGFDTVPKAGDPIVCVESEQVAEDLITRRKAAQGGQEADLAAVASDAELQSAGKHMMSHDWRQALEKRYGMDGETADDGPIRIPVLVKADADGTLAAIRDSLVQIGDTSVHDILIDPVKVGVGPVLATEVQLAKEFNAPIVCFNLKNEQTIVNLAEESGVPMLGSNVIYTVWDAAKAEFSKFLPAKEVKVVHGRGKVQAVYDIGGVDDKVAGLQVIEGTLIKDKTKGQSGNALECRYRVLRKGKPIAESLKATSLKHFKDDVESIGRGKECGLSLDGHGDFQEGDEIECFSIDMQRPQI